ncbi:5-nucleotidase [Levilactobacillus senmaizukei DSM 21775 = NBRC 103853]|uniref:5-nucleotidase n=1 Tax=Levilactobacillus senmaizukei DSM 21775 = NBRC 103853 TaxID=1423803 RepID=A0A0R2DAY5_9LACO|nr:bifunctional metallophosphatase/5'-nucleotidase [Levilactobacillus senmaizukei]KRN01183.1 5-nucleotidase [Levilactobacillus senmaizukei DSM 21775 = NBRC 103853]
MEWLTILHTNDLHSHFENWPRIRRYLTTTKRSTLASGESVFTFDLGDHVDRAQPFSEATAGQGNIQLMNQIGYDGATIGNNEGLGFTRSQLNHLYDQANFPVILGNLLTADQHRQPDWAVDHRLLTTEAGTKVLVLGLTAPYQLTYPLAGWQPVAAKLALSRLLAKYRSQANICVLLSHLGLDVDRELARSFPELDVIIGSHTHHLLRHGELVGQCLLAAAGKFGQFVGRIQLGFNSAHQLVSQAASVVATADLPVEAVDQTEITGLTTRGTTILTRHQFAQLPKRLIANPSGHPELVQLGMQAIAAAAGTQAAVLNAGLFLHDLPAGPVNKEQLLTLLPHGMHVMRVTLDGENLWRLVREFELARRFLRFFPQKGMGFRGKVFGELNYLGISYDPDTQTVAWQGAPLVKTRRYTLAMVDHYLFIPFFPTISIMGENDILYPELLREVFERYLALHYPLTIGNREEDESGS